MANSEDVPVVRMKLTPPLSSIARIKAEWEIENFAAIQPFITKTKILSSDWFEHKQSATKWQLQFFERSNKPSHYFLRFTLAQNEKFDKPEPRKLNTAFSLHFRKSDSQEVVVLEMFESCMEIEAGKPLKGIEFLKGLAKENLRTDGTLHIVVSIKFLQGRLDALRSTTFSSLSEPAVPLLKESALRKICTDLLLSGEASDFKIVVPAAADQVSADATTFDVHTFVLAQASPKFAKLFKSSASNTTGPHEISEFRSEVVSEMLKFVYGNKLDMGSYSQAFTIQLLLLAEKYEVAALISACGAWLIATMTTQNFVQIQAEAAKAASSNELQRIIVEWQTMVVKAGTNVCEETKCEAEGNDVETNAVSPKKTSLSATIWKKAVALFCGTVGPNNDKITLADV